MTRPLRLLAAGTAPRSCVDLDPDELLAELTDDLLAGGDLDDALRRLLRSGMRTADGERLLGCAR